MSASNQILTNTNTWESSTYYVRDAQGNVMSVYEHRTDLVDDNGALVPEDSYRQTECHIYGSSRLGIDTTPVDLLSSSPYQADVVSVNPDHKTYELTNHLGNVLATFTARKLPITDNGDITGFTAHVTSLTDYYPFGSALSGRRVTSGYRYGFQGQETDAEYFNGAVSFKYRVHDARLGRFLSVDPLVADFPWNSVYSFAMNMVIRFLELEGAEIQNPWVPESTKPLVNIPTQDEIFQMTLEPNVLSIPREKIPASIWSRIVAFEQALQGDTKWAFGVLYTTEQGLVINMSAVQALKDANLFEVDGDLLEAASPKIDTRKGGGLERQSLPDWEDPPISDGNGPEVDSSVPTFEGYNFLPYDANSYVGGAEDSIHVEGRKVTPTKYGPAKAQWGGDGLPKDTSNGKWKDEFSIEIHKVNPKR